MLGPADMHILTYAYAYAFDNRAMSPRRHVTMASCHHTAHTYHAMHACMPVMPHCLRCFGPTSAMRHGMSCWSSLARRNGHAHHRSARRRGTATAWACCSTCCKMHHCECGDDGMVQLQIQASRQCLVHPYIPPSMPPSATAAAAAAAPCHCLTPTQCRTTEVHAEHH